MAAVAVAAMTSLLAFGVSAVPLRSHIAPLAADANAELREQVGMVFQRFYDQRAPTAEKGDKGGKADQPLQVQVPEKEMEALLARLSPTCEQQFNDILHGKAELHTFGNPGTETSSAGCARLNGTLCNMDAEVFREADTQGRSLTSSTRVKGQGCLPSSCMASSDLQVLTAFMHSKAKSAIPTQGVEVRLHVDCSPAGGTTADAGQVPSKADAAGHDSSESGSSKADGASHSSADGHSSSAGNSTHKEESGPKIRGAGRDHGGAVPTASLSSLAAALLVVMACGSLLQ